MLGTAVVGSAGVGLNQIFIWPQVRRALTGVEGVATLTVLGGLFARASWTLYGIRLGDPILIVGNALVAGGFLLLFAALVHYSARRGFLVAQAVVVVAATAAAATAGTTVIGWTAVSAASAVYLPQMLRTMKEPRRASGVSVSTYLLSAAASACWFSYGFLVHQPLISAPHILLLPSALVTAWLVTRHQETPGIPLCAYPRPDSREVSAAHEDRTNQVQITKEG